MSGRTERVTWLFILGGLVLLFVVKYLETSDWKMAAIPVLSIITLIALVVMVVSILIFFLHKRPITATTYVIAGIALLGLSFLWLLQVPLNRLMIFVALSIFFAIVFIVADWMKGRFFR